MDTLVIGLDGGEWDIIDPLIENGELPNLAQLKQEGMSGNLKSITPPVSPPAWNSIQTGTNPGKHGVFDFSTFDENYNRRSINSSDRRSTPFWKVMNDYGTSTGLFKIPFTYPPEEVDGYLVSGFPTPNSVDDFVQPESLGEMVGSAENLFEDKSLYKDGVEGKFKENLIEIAEYQTELFLDLIDDHETEFAMSVYDGSDRIQHYFWKYLDEAHPRYDSTSPHTDAIKQYYGAVDDGIGRILEHSGDECDVLVISDHGFGPLSHDIYIDEWLDDEGILTRETQNLPDQAVTNIAAMTLRFGWDVIGRAGLQKLVRSVLPTSWFKFGESLQDDSHRTIVWDETEAFFSTLSGQALFINLEEQFTDGTVTCEEYDETVERVRKSLLSIRHPETNEQLVEAVVRSDEVYSGWMVDDAPDLIVRTSPEYTLKNGRSEKLIQPSKQYGQDRSGDHRTDGIFIASGPSFDRGTMQDASIIDIAPTLLHIHGCPIPETVDGTVLQDAIAKDIKEASSVKYTTKYGKTDEEKREWSESEEEALENRLRNMGYLN